jgi:hypothetical protein
VPGLIDHCLDSVLILRDHSHSPPDETGICAHCGQPLPTGHGHVHGYGDKRANWTGLAVTVLLHLLLLLAFLLRSQVEKHAPPPSGGEIAYIAPLEGKPKRKEMAKAEPKKVKQSKPEVVKIERLPDTITLPHEKPVERVEPEPPKIVKVDPAEDMTAAIEARRRARGQASSEQPGEESEKDRGNRLAMANIAAANGKSQGDDSNDSGGVFSITDKTFNSAQVKFKGWNPGFKRRWLTQARVDLGTERDIETAVVKKMIELIRKEKTGEFDWDSHRLQRIVKMSARIEDTAELEAFLFKEMFPGYQPPRGR